jgi:hypothetical protein
LTWREKPSAPAYSASSSSPSYYSRSDHQARIPPSPFASPPPAPWPHGHTASYRFRSTISADGATCSCAEADHLADQGTDPSTICECSPLCPKDSDWVMRPRSKVALESRM